MRVTLVPDVQEKEEVSPYYDVPMTEPMVAAYVQDILADETKHSEVTSWRVMSAVLA
jgi:hypothetical protein